MDQYDKRGEEQKERRRKGRSNQEEKSGVKIAERELKNNKSEEELSFQRREIIEIIEQEEVKTAALVLSETNGDRKEGYKKEG